MADVQSLDWPGMEVSDAWKETVLPFLQERERLIIDMLSDRSLCNTTDDLFYYQGQLSATRQMIEAPKYYMELRRLAAEADRPVSDDERAIPLYGRRDARLAGR